MRYWVLAIASTAIAACVPATSAQARAADWHVIGSAASSGEFAVVSADGTARHPSQIAVKVAGGGAISGFAVVSCSRGVGSIGSTSTSYKGRYAVLKLPMRGADSCDVVASASGSGNLKLQILSR